MLNYQSFLIQDVLLRIRLIDTPLVAIFGSFFTTLETVDHDGKIKILRSTTFFTIPSFQYVFSSVTTLQAPASRRNSTPNGTGLLLFKRRQIRKVPWVI